MLLLMGGMMIIILTFSYLLLQLSCTTCTTRQRHLADRKDSVCHLIKEKNKTQYNDTITTFINTYNFSVFQLT